MLNKNKRSGFGQVTPYIMAFIGLSYIVMGFFVLDRSASLPISESMAIFLGVLFIIYGSYRTWRAYKTFKEPSN